MGINPYEETLDAIDEQNPRATAAPTNPYLETLDSMESARVRAMKSATEKASAQQPDRAARVRKASEVLGLAPDVVDRNLEDFEKRVTIGGTPFTKILDQTPTLAEWSTESNNAAVAKEDLANLGALEWIVKAPSRAFAQSLHHMRAASLRTQELYRELTQEERDQLNAEKFAAESGGGLSARDHWFGGAVTGGGALLANVLGGAFRAGPKAVLGTAVGAVIGGAGGAVATGGPGVVPGAIAGGKFGFGVGAEVGAAQFGFELEAGLAFDEFLEVKDEHGKTIDRDAARVAAITAGTLNAGLEVVGLGVLARSFPGVEKLRGLAARGAVKQALKNPTIRAALVDVAKSYAGTLTAETAVEVAQRAVTIMGGELAKASSGVERLSAAEIAGDLANEAKGALEGFSLLSVPGPMLTLTRNLERVQRSDQAAAFFKALGEGVAQSDTVKRLPEAAQQFLERATADGPVEHIYIPAKPFREYFQSQGLDPAAVAEQLTGRKDALEQADLTGVDLEVKTATYAVKLAGTEHHQALTADLRLGADEMTGREAAAYRELLESELETRKAEVQAAKESPGAAVRRQIQEQLITAGVPASTAGAYATLYENAFGAMAERAGVDPTQLYARYGLKVERPDVGTAPDAGAPAGGTETPPPAGQTGTGGAIAGLEDVPVGSDAEGLLEAATAPSVRPPGPWDANTGAEGAPAAGQGAPGAAVDPDAPLDTTDPVAAALAMMREDPAIARKGEQLRARAAASRTPAPPREGSPAAAAGVESEAPDGEPVSDQPAPGEAATAAAAGDQLPGDAAQPAAADVGGVQPGGGTADRAGNRRRRSVPASQRDRLRSLLADADSQGFAGTARELVGSFLERFDTAQAIAQDLEREANLGGWRQLLTAVSRYGGISLDAETALHGELLGFMDLLAKSSGIIKKSGRTRVARQGQRVTLQSTGIKGAAGIFKRAGGRSFDDMRDLLASDPDFPGEARERWADLTAFMEDLEDAAIRGRAENLGDPIPGRATPDVDSVLEGFLEVIPGRQWWLPAGADPVTDTYAGELDDSFDAAALEGPLADTVFDELLTPPEGPVTATFAFDQDDFQGGSFPMFHISGGESHGSTVSVQTLEAMGLPVPERPAVDVLDTGEQQPRLPGDVGQVREQEVATPAEAAPFSLTSEVSKAKDADQEELFQSAFHGSPHTFEAFSLQAIGTGEGAQSYGWGLYFTSTREIADYYRKSLAGRQQQHLVSLSEAENQIIPDWVRTRIANEAIAGGDPAFVTQGLIENFRDRVAEDEEMLKPVTETEAAQARADGWGKLLVVGEPRAAQPWQLEARLPGLRAIVAALETVKARGDYAVTEFKPGRTYTVEIPENEGMLDWDKPLSQQPLPVQEGLRALGITWEPRRVPTPKQALRMFASQRVQMDAYRDIGTREVIREGYHYASTEDVPAFTAWFHKNAGTLTGKADTDVTGERLYEDLQAATMRGLGAPMNFRDAARLASEKLASVGVVGIRYLDGSSRRAGEGNHNFVVFDDRLVQITEFNQPLFHGTPHKVDRFSTAHIGTGEGAQAYGWGLYFAEAKETGEFYRDKLGQLEILIDGQPVNLAALEAIGFVPFEGTPEGTSEFLRWLLTERTADKTIAFLEQQLARAGGPGGSWAFVEGATTAGRLQSALDAGRQLRDRIEVRNAGRLYQVDVPEAQLAKMIDWDAPLAKQPMAVKDALRDLLKMEGYLRAGDNGPRVLLQAWRAWIMERGGMASPESGEMIYHLATAAHEREKVKAIRAALPPGLGPYAPQMRAAEAAIEEINRNAPREASLWFAARGIPGLKFFDQVSRLDERGTRNVVVFNDAIVDITHEDGSPLTAEERTEYFQVEDERQTPQFAAWFKQSAVVDESGAPLRVYHGTARLDRFGPIIRKQRATSGPMPYFTDDPTIASNYAKNKADTSLDDEERNYAQWFRMKVGRGQPVPIDRAWHFLTPAERARVAELAPRVMHGDDGELVLGPEGHNSGSGGYDQHILEARGNHFAALLEEWLNSGTLFGDERDFETILALAGAPVDRITFHDPNADVQGVVPVYLSIQHPLDTSNVPPEVIAALEQRVKRSRTKVERGGADTWDKRTRDPREWVQLLKADLAAGVNSFVWTSIPDVITDELRKLGYDGIADTGGKSGGMAHTVWIPFEPGQVKSAIGNRGTFDPASGNILWANERRGSLKFGADRQMTLSLFEHADLSTFLHESGHFFLEVFGDLRDNLLADGSPRSAQQQQLLTDYNGLLEWLGVTDRSQVATEHHERFARAFEAYLMEGQAPSEELRSTFARFRAWLLGIYRSLSSLDVKLNPEVRAIFDRLLATDQAIGEAAIKSELIPLFATPEMAGMSPEAFALYGDKMRQASQTARERLEQRLLSEVSQEQKAERAARRIEVERQVTGELAKRPVYRVLAAMRTGTTPTGEALDTPLVPLRLSRKMLVERFGKERLKSLPRPYIYSREGGLDPDGIAETFDFDSADAMLTAIEQARPFADAVTLETDRRMQIEQPSLLFDGARLEEAAQAALSNEDREIVIRAELRALGSLKRAAAPFVAAERRAGAAKVGAEREKTREAQQEASALKAHMRSGPAIIRGAVPNMADLREMAERQIRRSRIRDIKPAPYWAASRRAAKLAIEAAARGDFDTAIVEKQRELLTLALYREAERVLEDVDKRVRRAKRYGTTAGRAVFGLAGDAYLDQVDGILDRYEFATVSNKVLERRASLRKFVAALEGEGLPVEMPEAVLEEHRRINYREVSYEELIGVVDALDHLAHLARFKVKLLKSAKKGTFDDITGAFATSIHFHSRGEAPKVERDRRPSGERKRTWRSFGASHRKLADMIADLDGDIDGGLGWTHLMNPLNQAGSALAERQAAASKAMLAIVERAFPSAREKQRLYEKTLIPAIGQSLSRMERIMVALNMGNAGNRQRMESFEKWTPEQMQAIVDTLTRAELTFVQETIDFIGEFWPEIEAKAKRVTGLAPEKVDAMPIVAAAGTIPGGYFPIKYDDRISASVIGKMDVDAANLAKAAAYTQATTRRGHEQARLEKVTLPLRRDFGVIAEHVNQVLLDLTHHETLVDVSRILSNREVQDAIMQRYGDTFFRAMRDAVKDIAHGDVGAIDGFEQALNHVRIGTTVAMLGWKFSVSAMQLAGLTNSMNQIGTKWVAKGVASWMRDTRSIEGTAAWIHQVSPFMRSRHRTMQREIAEIRNQVGVESGTLKGWVDATLESTGISPKLRQGVADSYFWMIQKMQSLVDVPTWLGAFEKAMAAGETEERAVALADQAVLSSQGGGQTKDLARVQRGGPMMKLWTNFYSFFNTLYQQFHRAHRRKNLKNPVEIGRLAGDYLQLLIIPAALGFLYQEAMRARSDDDDDDVLERLIVAEVTYPMGMMLGVREFSAIITGAVGYEGPAGARAFASMGRFATQAKQLVTGYLEEGVLEENLDAAFFRSLNETAGTFFHYPAAQVWNTLAGIKALAEGKTENPAAVVSGPPRGNK